MQDITITTKYNRIYLLRRIFAKGTVNAGLLENLNLPSIKGRFNYIFYLISS